MDVPDSNEPDTDESFDQVCYVLHGAPPPAPRQPGRPPRGAANVEPTHGNTLPPCLPDEPPLCGLWRQNAFHVVWSRLQSLIRVTLEEQNESNFKDISEWVRDRQFSDTQQQLYRSASDELFEPESSTYIGLFNRKLDTALLFLGGIDPSDHESIFDGLSTHLKSQNCHVARLVASDFPSKCHVGVPLYSLLRQFTKIQPETTDMEILAAWHSEEGNHGRPLVIIVEHVECCSVTTLAELIILLSEWSAELPIVLVMGVATTVDYLQRFLPSSALGQLVATAFILKSPLERLESVVRAVLVDSFCAFELSHLVAKHLHMHFLRYDLTVSSFVMSLKVACMEHFCSEPLSFVSQWLLRSSSQGELEKQCATLPVELLEYAARLPSAESVEISPENMSKQIASSLWRFKEQKQLWIVALLCAVEVGDHLGVGFLELFVHALCPMQSAKESENVQQPRTRVLNLNWQNLVCKLREQTPSVLRSVLEEWKRLTSTVNELHAEVCTVYNKFTASVPSITTQHPDTSKSPLRRRPSAENNNTGGSPMKECSPEGAQKASSPSKTESPRRTSSRLTPAKRLISDASPSSSPNRVVVVDPSINPYGSPRRPSTRSLASDLDAAASGEVPKSPAKYPKSPAKTPKSPAKTPKSPAKTPKSPAKTPKSPAKTPKSPAKTPWKPPPKSPGKTPSRRLLQSPEKYSEAQQPMSRSDLRRLASQNSGGVVRSEAHPSNELVADLFERIILQYLVPTEDLPFHEIICFRNVSSLKQAMTGATRQKVHLDLLGSQLRLQCECCDSDGGLTNSMHDTCLAYQLIQEHNELVNVHDWYYSFVSICCPAAKKGKGKKAADKTSVADSVTTQARFTRAATELQIAGLLRMPKKGRPDFPQRVCIN